MGVLAAAFALSYQWERKLEIETGVKPNSHGHRAGTVIRQRLESLHRMLNFAVSLSRTGSPISQVMWSCCR
jgi:hypothetical protein